MLKGTRFTWAHTATLLHEAVASARTGTAPLDDGLTAPQQGLLEAGDALFAAFRSDVLRFFQLPGLAKVHLIFDGLPEPTKLSRRRRRRYTRPVCVTVWLCVYVRLCVRACVCDCALVCARVCVTVRLCACVCLSSSTVADDAASAERAHCNAQPHQAARLAKRALWLTPRLKRILIDASKAYFGSAVCVIEASHEADQVLAASVITGTCQAAYSTDSDLFADLTPVAVRWISYKKKLVRAVTLSDFCNATGCANRTDVRCAAFLLAHPHLPFPELSSRTCWRSVADESQVLALHAVSGLDSSTFKLRNVGPHRAVQLLRVAREAHTGGPLNWGAASLEDRLAAIVRAYNAAPDFDHPTVANVERAVLALASSVRVRLSQALVPSADVTLGAVVNWNGSAVGTGGGTAPGVSLPASCIESCQCGGTPSEDSEVAKIIAARDTAAVATAQLTALAGGQFQVTTEPLDAASDGICKLVFRFTCGVSPLETGVSMQARLLAQPVDSCSRDGVTVDASSPFAAAIGAALFNHLESLTGKGSSACAGTRSKKRQRAETTLQQAVEAPAIVKVCCC